MPLHPRPISHHFPRDSQNLHSLFLQADLCNTNIRQNRMARDRSRDGLGVYLFFCK